jgi:hypothetical protein
MSDENDTPTGPTEGSENDGNTGETTYRVTPYLTKSKMLLVPEVVYCLEHTAIHDDTVNPFGEGPESWCDAKEHRTVYYRARKGDIDESLDQDEIRAQLVGEPAVGESRGVGELGEGTVVVDSLTDVQQRVTRRIIAESSLPLSADERRLMLWLVTESQQATGELGDTIRRVFGPEDDGLAKVARRLELLASVARKLGGLDGESGEDRG